MEPQRTSPTLRDSAPNTPGALGAPLAPPGQTNTPLDPKVPPSGVASGPLWKIGYPLGAPKGAATLNKTET